MDSYGKLAIAAFLPVVMTALVWMLDRMDAFQKMSDRTKQILIGIAFGGLAILGTEWGIPMNGAQVNVRDAAPLVAGLLFGGPAGIIAGVIGGVERWFAIYWGVGTFTRVACTVSTILAGIYAAMIRRNLFENKRPRWYIALASGIVMEVFHLSMVFVTNLTHAEQAVLVVKACAAPMIIANGVSVMLATLVLNGLNREYIGFRHEKVRISDAVQRRLFIVVLIAYIVTSLFAFTLQMGMASSTTEALLDLSIKDVTLDVADASDESLLEKTRTVTNVVAVSEGEYLAEVAKRFEVEEINVVDRAGYITDSSNSDYIGFNMYNGPQSSAFCKLLIGLDEYVQDYGPIAYDSSVWMKYAGVALGDGFVQVGVTGEQMKQEIANQIRIAVQNRHIGETGYLVITDKGWNVVSAPDSFEMTNLGDVFAESAVRMKRTDVPSAGELFEANVLDVPSYVKYATEDEYTIIAIYPKEEALKARDVAVYVNTFMQILVLAAMFGLIYMIIRKIIVERMYQINGYLEEITKGDLDVEVDVRTNQEFTELSDGINATVSTLKHYIAEAAQRIDKELEMAKNIQASALPSRFPAYPNRDDFDIYATMTPAKEVGGDFYDFYFTEKDVFHVLIADVSGKGIPAAMFMMRAKTELKTLTEAGQEIASCFTNGNAALCEGNDAEMFVTAWQGTVDLRTGAVRFANAGHNPPVVYRAETGRFEYLRTRPGFVLAGMEGIRYKEQSFDLKPGDVLFLYTDGVTEATDANNELYGEERLLTVLNSRKWDDMQALLTAVKADIDAFVGDAPQFDDITMVGFRFIGKAPKPSIRFDEAKIADIPAVTEFVEAELEKLGCPMKAVMQIDIAIDELYSNIANYAYKGIENKGATVEVGRTEDGRGVEITFTDNGIPYNPVKYEDPDTTLSADERPIGGLGIYMVKQSMDDMRYEYHDGRNMLTIRKDFGPGAAK